ncbi:methyltransferase [Pseudonocardia hispaniensis]|uniref:Methyltransferase n=1 Tax=Pseudonocardia hispaniensis TaxID=904933 RepID=A0ABW1IY89_9PSEU
MPPESPDVLAGGPTESRSALERMLHAYRTSQVLVTAAELGVFGELGDHPVSAGELAAALGVQVGPLSALLGGLEALDLVQRTDAGYLPSATARAHLVPEAPMPMGGWVRGEASRIRSWAGLTRALRDGAEEVRSDPPSAEDPQRGLLEIARGSREAIAAAVQTVLDPRAPARILDVGGGHGAYSADLVQTHPMWSAVVADRPGPLAVARRVAADAGVGERVEVREVELPTARLGHDFDLALLFMVLVAFERDQVPTVLRGVHDAVRPGGYVLVRGFYWRDALEAALFDIQSHLHHGGCRAYSVTDVSEWLVEAGFDGPRLLDSHGMEKGTLLMARKPEQSR